MQTVNVPNKVAKARTTASKKKAAARVGDMTVDQLRQLIREAVFETLVAMRDPDYDPEDEVEFKPEVAAYLEKALKEKSRGRPMEEVMAELGISLD